MKIILQIIWFYIILVSQIHESAGIRCYKCLYDEGDSSSSQTCEYHPTDLETVSYDGYPPSRNNQDFTASMFKKIVGLENPQTYQYHNNVQGLHLNNDAKDPVYKYPYCSIIRGVLNGKKYVKRGALGGNETHPDYYCRNGLPASITLPVVNPKTCSCNTDLCNVGNWDGGEEERTRTTTPGGASAVRLNLVTLLLIGFMTLVCKY